MKDKTKMIRVESRIFSLAIRTHYEVYLFMAPHFGCLTMAMFIGKLSLGTYIYHKYYALKKPVSYFIAHLCIPLDIYFIIYHLSLATNSTNKAILVKQRNNATLCLHYYCCLCLGLIPVESIPSIS